MIDISKAGTFAGPNPIAALAWFLRESDVDLRLWRRRREACRQPLMIRQALV
jgi:hypothetical protein